jgi:DNA-binding response OmpR family regulator
MNILIVEDETLYGNVLEFICHSFGLDSQTIQVMVATSLAKSDEIRRTFVPDLVFSDMDLPDGNGISRFEEMRKQNPKVLICLLTGNLIKPEDHGADYFFFKNNFNAQKAVEVLRNSQSRQEK